MITIPSMKVDSVEHGISRMKSILFALEELLVGTEYIDDEELEAIKNLVDMGSECIRGIEEANENKQSYCKGQ